MLWFDRIEKVGRFVLWLSLASAVVLMPLTYINFKRSAELQQEESAREAARKASEPPKDNRLRLDSMGSIMTALNVPAATGRVWFSNVSSRTGIVCIVGTATNPNTNMTTDSLPSCKQISSYATGVEMQMMFADRDVAEICKATSCRLSIKDVPDVVAPAELATARQ
jgi:hypothetical protein